VPEALRGVADDCGVETVTQFRFFSEFSLQGKLASLSLTPYTEFAAIHQRSWGGMKRRRGHVRYGNPA
jgi:hypothetical protein